MKKFTYLLFASLILASCGNKSNSEHATANDENCTYSYDDENDIVEWTAYKFMDRTPVKGTFNIIDVESVSEAKSAEELIKSISFKISTESVETQNPERNANISKYFFGTISTPEITGKFKRFSSGGKASFVITMNKQTLVLEGDCTLKDNLFTFKSGFDLESWNALPGIAALNEQCKELHTGPDGGSVLWSEVDVTVSVPIIKNCK